MKYETLKPFITVVENGIVKTIIGAALYDTLDGAITGGNPSAEETAILELLRPMIANFTLYEALPQLSVMISDIGVQEVRSQDGSSAPAQIWRYNDSRWSYFRMGDQYRELVYKLLQENQSDYPDWVGSSAYTTYYQYFIKNNTDFHAEIGKGENCNTYLSLLPFLKLSQSRYITPLIGTAFQDALLDKVKTGSLSSEESEVISLIKSALAWFTLSESLPSISPILMDGNLITSYPGEKSRVYVPLSPDEKTALRLEAERKAGFYIGRLKNYLVDNASSLTLFDGSDEHTALIDENTPDYYASKNSFGLFI
jgi:hypothetical protein